MTKSSNLTGLSWAEEASLKVLSSPTWYALEPNSYANFGGSISTVSRTPIDALRQNKKGTITDVEAAAGFDLDHTKTSLNKLLQGVFFADARDKPSTRPILGAGVAVSGVTTTEYNAASGLADFNVVDMLVWAEGFGVESNNGLKLVDSADATGITIDGGLTAEASPPAAAKVTAVGQQFLSGDLVVTISSGVITLTSSGSDWPVLLPGEWILIGGDATDTFFATMPRGYGRVRTRTAAAVVLDDFIGVGGASAAADAGTGKTIQVFFGAVIRNEFTTALIKRRTYTLEQQLGTGPTATQAQYVRGAMANECTWDVPGQDKITVSMSFVACESSFKSGESGDEIESGTRVAALGENCFNTSADVRFTKLALAGTTSSQAPFFAYATEESITINNNARTSKALGVVGAIDVQPGNFEVTASLNAYFETTGVLAAIRENPDVSYSRGVFSAEQCGFIIDIPLLQVSGEPEVAKDEDIMVPLELAGAQNKFGYTALYNYFAYVPAAFVA